MISASASLEFVDSMNVELFMDLRHSQAEAPSAADSISHTAPTDVYANGC